MDDPTFSVHRVVRSTLSDEIAKHSAPVVLPAAELTRLRKIEAAARAVADGAYIWHISEDECVLLNSHTQFCQLVTDLRKSLETDADG